MVTHRDHMEPFSLLHRAMQSREIYYMSRDHHNAHELTNHTFGIHRLRPACGRRERPKRCFACGAEKADEGPLRVTVRRRWPVEVFLSEEAVALPLQKSVQDHRREQLPYRSNLKTISLVEIIMMILLI